MQKDFDTWNQLKKKLEIKPVIFCNAREIWWCSIGANIGAEASGKNELFERPVLVLKVYSIESILVAPLTSKPKDNPYHVRVTYADREGWLILSHARTISPKRLQRKMYRIGKRQHKKVLAALLNLVGKPMKKRAKTKSAPLTRGLGARRPDERSVPKPKSKSSRRTREKFSPLLGSGRNHL